MAATAPRYSKDEFARRGDAIYQKEVLPKLAAKDVGWVARPEVLRRAC